MARLGLIARADNSGLGTQTLELYRHLKPHRTLVIDLGHLADDGEHCNKRSYLDRFPDALVVQGLTPPPDVIDEFLRDLDVAFSAETFYTPDLVHRASYRNVKTVLQYNYEFLDHLQNPNITKPTLFAAPSLWNFEKVPFENKRLLRVPIATDRFTPRSHPKTAHSFLHSVGRPAVHDRNGTKDLLASLQYVKSDIEMILVCQDRGFLNNLISLADIPDNIQLTLKTGDIENYWDNYSTGDVLVLPRRFGGLCLPTNEAIGAGMPVIMTNIDPNYTWLPHRWLVKSSLKGSFTVRAQIDYYSADHRELARKIDQFATDPDFYEDAQRMVRLLASLNSWTRLEEEYKQLLSGLADESINPHEPY